MTAEICKFPVAESEGDEIERLRAGMRAWRAAASRVSGSLEFLVWREVELAMGVDDLCLVRNAAATLKELTDLLDQLHKTHLGGYLEMPHSFLAMTRRSPYVDTHQHEGQEGASTTMRIIGRKYLFIYPFVKTHDWYQ